MLECQQIEEQWRQLTAPLKTLCCTTVIPVGTAVKVIGQYSKNRVLIRLKGGMVYGAMHKVKYSAVRSRSVYIEDEKTWLNSK